jgi:methionyl-tRNA formyltransferase
LKPEAKARLRPRVVFAGTPEFAVPCLRMLLAAHARAEIALVGCYSQPDRPAGRGQKLTASPIKQAAQAAGFPVYTPESLRTPEAIAELAALAPDLLIVVAYGQILRKKVLQLPRFGCWNVHASLLPRWRGAAPIQRAVEAGDAETGVCLMHMEAGLDTGPVYLQASCAIGAEDTAASLHDRLAELGAALLSDGLDALRAARLPAAQPQPELGVSYAHKLDKSEAKLDLTLDAAMLVNKIRAFVPFPLAEVHIAGERVQVLAARVAEASELAKLTKQTCAQPEGTLLHADKTGLFLRCGQNGLQALVLQSLRSAQGKTISAADFLNGRPQLRS